MTGKEKAKELFNTYWQLLMIHDVNHRRLFTKRCALICLGKMYNFESNGYDYEDCNPFTQERLNELDKIKEEIKNYKHEG
jgi:hypothetical protein